MQARLLAPVGAALLMLAGCVSVAPQSAAINPYPAAPALQAEVIPQPPVSEDPVIWQPGHWDWLGSAFVWRNGQWIARAGHGTMWQQGYWSNQTGTWLWVPAHWV